MAQLVRTTKNNKLITEDLKLLSIGQNLKDVSKKTTSRIALEFERENSTKIIITLYKSEVSFLKKDINNDKAHRPKIANEIILRLPQVDMFNIACYELGRFFSDDAMPDECLMHWDNISTIRSLLDNKHTKMFDKIISTFISKKEEIKKKSANVYNKFIDETKDIWGITDNE